MTTMEATSYVHGVYKQFGKLVQEYQGLTAHLLELQGRILLEEKQLQVARDHLCMVIETTPGCVPPPQWDTTLRSVRFVGLRLADACLQVLKEYKEMTTEELINALNHGMYRWRSSSPARELNAAMLRQKNVKRQEDKWYYIPEPSDALAQSAEAENVEEESTTEPE